MTILEIYEKVNLLLPIEQRRFFNHLNDTINELDTLYPNFVFPLGTEKQTLSSLSDDILVLPLYHEAIVDNIVFLAGQNRDTYKGEFIRKSRLAYLKYWKDNAKGKRVKRMRW